MQAKSLELFDLHPQRANFLQEVIDGLTKRPKRLPCMYFYDERGSQLFDQICELEEYYPTRTEISILRRHATDIAEKLGDDCMLVELGSGSSLKTSYLLSALKRLHSYVPVDISKEHLLQAAERVAARFAGLHVAPVCADFMGELRLPPLQTAPARKYVWFPGSTIGNFGVPERVDLLRRIRKLCLPEGGGLLIGIDLKKDRERLEKAYNDAAGVTADFNLNLLRRINRELHGDFQLQHFHHRAVYEPSHSRIEMHLVSKRTQAVAIGGRQVEFDEGESICTEHSYKFSIEEFSQLAQDCGLELQHTWTDEEDLFAVLLLTTR